MNYCEQMSALGGFEPWNALTNAGFLLAAAWGWRALRAARRALPPGPRSLPFIAAAIGLGSFAWHATGAAWAELADVLPIVCFVLVFLASALRGVLGCSARVAGLACVTLVAAAVAVGAAAGSALNGSAAYLPVWAGLCTLAWLAARKGSASRHGFAAASAVFAVSLAFRTLDLDLCANTAIGTHWLWHLLNALLLAGLMSLLVRYHRGLPPDGPGHSARDA
jgi:hypothetical protein